MGRVHMASTLMGSRPPPRLATLSHTTVSPSPDRAGLRRTQEPSLVTREHSLGCRTPTLLTTRQLVEATAAMAKSMGQQDGHIQQNTTDTDPTAEATGASRLPSTELLMRELLFRDQHRSCSHHRL